MESTPESTPGWTPARWNPAKRNDSRSCGGSRMRSSRYCCVFFIFLLTIPFVFTSFYHAYPTTVIFVVFVVMMHSFIPLVFNHGEIVTATPVGPLLSAMMLSCSAMIFLFTLRYYYGHVQPLRELMVGRQYNGVYPQLAAVSFGDAAFLTFTNGSIVDKSKSLSMKSLDSGMNDFCVAPIDNDANTGRVEFWAVGADCCSGGRTGNFDCDDAADTGARNAWVLRPPTDALYESLGKHISPPISRRDIFMEAITQAEHEFSITTSDDAVLVRWTKKSKADLIAGSIGPNILVFLAIIVSAAFMAIFLAIVNAWYLDLLHREHGHTDLFVQFRTTLEKQEQEIKQHSKAFRPELTTTDLWVFGVMWPFLVFFLCLVLASYGGCVTYGALTLMILLSLVAALTTSMFMMRNRVINGLCIMLCALGGLHIGFINYENNMFQYCSIGNKQTYRNVMPDANAADYADAEHCLAGNGTSNSSGSTALIEWSTPRSSRTQKLNNIKYGRQISAAMINDGVAIANGKHHSNRHTISTLQEDAGANSTPCATRVEFWAMGVDCCDARKNFKCDDAKDESAKAAIVVHPFSSYLPHFCRKLFFPDFVCDSLDADRDGGLAGAKRQLLNAVNQSVAANGLTTPEHVVFIRLGKNADDLQVSYRNNSLVIVAITSVLALVCMITISHCDEYVLKKMRQKEEAEVPGSPA